MSSRDQSSGVMDSRGMDSRVMGSRGVGFKSALIAALLSIGLTNCGYEDPAKGQSEDGVVIVTPQFDAGAIFIPATGDITQAIQEALINAQSGDTIVIPKGTHKIKSTLTFDGDADGDQIIAKNITIAGYGMDVTILDFADSASGDGIFVQNALNITLQDLSVREAANNGIKLKDSNGIIMRRVSAVWEGELGPDNGAYGLYPVECQNILIEDSYVRGSADAGIYVGQSEYIVVRRSVAKENVAGIEIENSKYADVYDNEAFGNTGGILVFDLPIGNHVYGSSVRVFNNKIYNNNTLNFANSSSNPAGVHIVPPGTGVIVLSTSDVEVFNNDIRGHDTMSVAISSFFIAEQDIGKFVSAYGQAGQAIEDGWRPVPRNISVHDNTISNSSAHPNGSLIKDIIDLYQTAHGQFPAILYDGLGAGLANDGLAQLLGLKEEPLAADGSENVCVQNNANASIGQLFKEKGINPDAPDTLFETTQNELLNCTLISLPVHTVTYGDQVFGCGVDDDFAGCDGRIVGNAGDTDQGVSGVAGDGDKTLCDKDSAGVNWEALLGANCTDLSSYNLFADKTNPTAGPNDNGMPYDLITPLFTDYASKYRFVFLPPGANASYNDTESFDFPVGTVIAKTFALPADTSTRGFTHEELIETRLLIRRASGWTALPYVWNTKKADAVLTKAGAVFDSTITHNGEQLNFAYRVPKVTDCKQCHQLKTSEDAPSVFSPIGTKARHLNKEFAYANGTSNQLTAWTQAGILSGVPTDLSSIKTLPAFADGDETKLAAMSDTQVMDLAKGYLDVNCAHCHRPEGNASNTGLKLEYWRPYDDGDQGIAHGTCKQPIAYGGGALGYDVVPGKPDNSIMHFRMNSTAPGDRMPEIGRSLVHEEGAALIYEWIKRLPAAGCSN